MVAKKVVQTRQKKKQARHLHTGNVTQHDAPMHNMQSDSARQLSSSKSPYSQAAILQTMQNELGNRSTLRIIQHKTIHTQVNNTIAQRDDRTQSQKSDPNIERFRKFGIEQEFTQTRCAGASDEGIISYVNEIIDSFSNAELRSQIGSNIKNRVDFLIGMTRYLGSVGQVVAHFSSIEQVGVPGDVNLHSSAAARLKMVADYLQQQQMTMPATSVALGLRDRYRPHQRNSKGKMAHPLGYAIDYRAVSNPMITDSRLAELLELQGNGAINFQFEDARGNAMNFVARRSLIKEMGAQMTSGGLKEEMKSRADSFLTQFENEFARVSQVSKTFKNTISESMSTVKLLWKKQEALSTELAKLKRKRSAKQKEQAAIVQQELDEVTAQLAPFKGDLAKLFQPWIESITAKQQQLEQSASAITITVKDVNGERRITGKELFALSDADMTRLNRLAARRRGATVTVEGIANLKRDFEPIWKKYSNLRELGKALSENPDFVFEGESSVKNPAVMQLLDKGFFTPDEEPESMDGKSTKANPNQHGFNLKFMQTMAMFGFDQGISWSPTSLDAMHFELVEGVDSISEG